MFIQNSILKYIQVCAESVRTVVKLAGLSVNWNLKRMFLSAREANLTQIQLQEEPESGKAEIA
jgi:hypothetical protein